MYSVVDPEPVSNPRMVFFHSRLAAELGLPDVQASPVMTELLGGNVTHPSVRPIAMAYAGHQFGHFTTLGDGRALLIGEIVMPGNQRFDLHLKGTGRTPYSRQGDGRATLASMLREVIISEALHHLGIPTTRSLAVVTTGERVLRDAYHQGAILTRVARSHIRVGTFQWAALNRDGDVLATLLDYTVERHYPHITSQPKPWGLAFLHAVIKAQAHLVAQWLGVGFIHGVMNTDNILVSGESIDFGPCAFLDRYDPHCVYSSIDQTGRYAFGNQPFMAQWSLARLAETLLPFIHSDLNEAQQWANKALSSFEEHFAICWRKIMAAKLGLSEFRESDDALIKQLLGIMHQHDMDYTLTFRNLVDLKTPDALVSWKDLWLQRCQDQKDGLEGAQQRMVQVNPAVIPRNHRVEEAIIEASENNHWKPFQDLLAALRDPYETPAKTELRVPPLPHEEIRQTFCGT